MKKLTTPNQAEGREDHGVSAVVVHTCDGEGAGCVEWCMNPESKVSYHYIIEKDGEITELVDTHNTAWHAGKRMDPTWEPARKDINPNLYTVGIAFAGNADEEKTHQQMFALAALIADVSIRHQFAITEQTIVYHREIRADKTCPGNMVDKAHIARLAKTLRETGIYKMVI